MAALVLGLIVIALFAIRFTAPDLWSKLTNSVWHAGNTVSVRVTGSTESKASLKAARDRYEEQVTALTSQNAALSAQVADLTKLLGSRAEPAPGIVAAVVARPPVAPYDVLILDQGTSAGVLLGSLVTGNGGTPIGTIGQADRSQSRVTLFSTQGIKTSGWAGESRIPVTLTGEGAGAYKTELPKTAGAKVGDAVYLANAGAYPVGTVIKIESDPSSPSVRLDVRPYANPFSLTWVTIERR